MSTAELSEPLAGTAELWHCTIEEYHRDKSRLGNSMLKVADKSLAKFHYRYISGKAPDQEPTPAQLIGTVAHALTFEREEFNARFSVAPKCDRRTTAGKAAYAEFELAADGKTVVAHGNYATAYECAEAVASDRNAAMLLDLDGVCEQAIVWRDQATGILCKCRPDKALIEAQTILDLKTCGDCSFEGFAKQAHNLDYHRQAAWYQDGYEVMYGVKPAFVFICVETEPPYEVACHELDDESIEMGRKANARALAMIAEARLTGVWTSQHSRQINRLSLPRYAFSTDYLLS